VAADCVYALQVIAKRWNLSDALQHLSKVSLIMHHHGQLMRMLRADSFIAFYLYGSMPNLATVPLFLISCDVI